LLFIFMTLFDAMYLLMSIRDILVQAFQMSILVSAALCRFRSFIVNFSATTSSWILVLIACDRSIRARFRGVATRGRVRRNASPAFRIQLRNASLLLKILFFLNTKSKKSTFSGLFSYSIYLKEDITTPLFCKNLAAKDLRPLLWTPSYALGSISTSTGTIVYSKTSCILNDSCVYISVLATCYVLFPEFAYTNILTNWCGPANSPVTAYSIFYFNVSGILQVFIIYIAPACLLIVGMIGIYSKVDGQRNLVARSTRRERLQRQMLILMISSISCFIICTILYTVHRIIYLRLGTNSETTLLVSIFSIFLNMNYSYNFYINCLTSKLFREEFIQQLKRFYIWCKIRIGYHNNVVHTIQTQTMIKGSTMAKGPALPTVN
jgi:hypothetical protein